MTKINYIMLSNYNGEQGPFTIPSDTQFLKVEEFCAGYGSPNEMRVYYSGDDSGYSTKQVHFAIAGPYDNLEDQKRHIFVGSPTCKDDRALSFVFVIEDYETSHRNILAALR